MKRSFQLFFMLFILSSVFYACKKEVVPPSEQFSLEKDSVTFDTVFTRIGSTTKYFKIYNAEKGDLTLSSIRLAGGDESQFRININGVNAAEMDDVVIHPEDWIYVFVEVTVDPTDVESPFLLKDSILFNLGGEQKKVILTAFGQNANYIKGNINGRLMTQDWDSTLPYLIYDYAYVDTNQTLTIGEGTKLYFHGNTSLHVFGTLNVQGTAEHPVEFQGSRLEPAYYEIAGQWGGIHLWKNSKQNVINHAIIKNCIYGVRVDSLTEGEQTYKLQLQNTIIKNSTASAVLGFTGSIYCDNSLFYNCGLHAIRLEYGGFYRFNYCTVYGDGNHTYPAVRISNYYQYQGQTYLPAFLDVDISNSILYGTLDEEFDFSLTDLSSNGGYNAIAVKNCVIKTEDVDTAVFKNCIVNQYPSFVDPTKELFQLQSGSPAIDIGLEDTLGVVTHDIEDNMRPLGTGNDAGCYESF